MRRGITAEAREEHFKLPSTRRDQDMPWVNEEAFLRDVDQLARGPKWTCTTITIEGDNMEQGGRRAIEEYTLWARDIVDCVRELIGNPVFKGSMHFAPERHFSNAVHTARICDEMWTGDWWWKTQTLLPPGATVAAIIMASDKTQLTKLSGDKQAWPVYMSLGNITKDLRRKISKHATVLVTYIPVTKLKCFQSKSRRQREHWDFFHSCMKEIMRLLLDAGNSTLSMVCCDGFVRDVQLVIAAYIADHPERCLVSCVRKNRCPSCVVQTSPRERLEDFTSRNPRDTLDAIRASLLGRNTDDLEFLGLRPVWPFWARLPPALTNPHTWFWPDLLHQMTKGMFEHLKDWIVALAGVDEIDSRCETVPRYPGLKHFSKGLSDVTQWTGNEYKDLIRILLATSVHAVPDQALIALRVFTNFYFLASLHCHTQHTITLMNHNLELFHSSREVFKQLGVVNNFNFPKAHSINHIPNAIPQIGALDGTNSEGPERLLIDFAKVAYHAVKKTDYIRFMTIWLDRQEALNRHETYINWVHELEAHDPGLYDVSDVDDDEIQMSRNPTTHMYGSLDPTAFISAGSRRYLIANRPSFKPKPNMHASEMTRTFGLFGFLTVVNDFLVHLADRHPMSPMVVSEQHIFTLWSRFRILYFYNQNFCHVSRSPQK